MASTDAITTPEFHQHTNPEFYSTVSEFTREEILDPRTQKIVDYMLSLVFFDYEANQGDVGLALPQLVIPENLRRPDGYDRDQRSLIVALSFASDGSSYEVHEYFNPKIIEASAEQTWGFDACLSVEERAKFVLLPRPKTIKVEWLDRNADFQGGTFSEDNARYICHEIDHVKPKPVTIVDIPGVNTDITYTKDEVIALYTGREKGISTEDVPLREALRRGLAA